jgi:hypothetical protein
MFLHVSAIHLGHLHNVISLNEVYICGERFHSNRTQEGLKYWISRSSLNRRITTDVWIFLILLLPTAFWDHFLSRQAMNYTYKVTLKCVREIILQWRNNKYYTTWLCICSLRYPACNAHTPYCYLRPARVYNTFPKRRNFLKKLLKIKCVFCFSLQLLSEIFLILRRNERHTIKHILVFMYSTRHSCLSLMNIEFYQHIYEKCSNIKFHENPSIGSRVAPCGQSGGRTDMRQPIVAFWNFADEPKNGGLILYQPIYIDNFYSESLFYYYDYSTCMYMWAG